MKGLILSLSVYTFSINAQAQTSTVAECWSEWKNGNIESAIECANKAQGDRDSREHLLMNIAFAKGEYVEVLRRLPKIPVSSPESKSVVRLSVQAYLNLLQPRSALKLALSSGLEDSHRLTELRELAKHPISFHLKGVDVVPFKQDPLTAFMPSFDVKVNGVPLVGQIDTGGNYVVMSSKLAAKLGIQSIYIGDGNGNDQPTKLWLGHGDFQLGALKVTNAPVYVMESLNGSFVENRPIFGTSILSQFLVTFDYPKQRLILSPKNSAQARRQHFSMLSPPRSVQNFYLWGDHYMFAKGSVGSHDSLNFFIDTGLVVLDKAGRQASFYGMTETFKSWGYSAEELANPLVNMKSALSLGNLEQSGALALHSNHFPVPSLGGVEIHGLISHAFFKNYTWTLDFAQRKYLFSN